MKYLTLYGESTICTKHASLKSAIRAARKCEKEGGYKHFIWSITKYNLEGKKI